VSDCLRKLPRVLTDYDGGACGCVCIWREFRYDFDSYRYRTTVGEFLSQPWNRSGAWLIASARNFQPAYVRVEWNEDEKCWGSAEIKMQDA
jgi:hypothetical protein